jgi:hypothetical protein
VDSINSSVFRPSEEYQDTHPHACMDGYVYRIAVELLQTPGGSALPGPAAMEDVLSQGTSTVMPAGTSSVRESASPMHARLAAGPSVTPGS